MATSSSSLAERPAARPEPPPAPTKESWWSEALAVLAKDLRSEWRSSSAVVTVLIFAVGTMSLVAMTVNTWGPGLTIDYVRDPAGGPVPVLRNVNTENRALLLAGLYWIILFFSAMAGLPRVFVKEQEMRTAPALRLAARPLAVFAGKLLFNVALLEAVVLLLLPLFTVYFQPQVHRWPELVGSLLAGAAALAAAATILSAMVSRARNGGYLMVVLGLGPLLPILALGIKGASASITGSGGNNIVALVSYGVVMTLVSGALFESVWSD